MKLFARALVWVTLVVGIWTSQGCAVSERQIARRQDLTPEIIRQSTDLIAADPELARHRIVVDGFKGSMRLKGDVETASQKARAEKLVWAVRGVKSVNNELQVRGAAPR